MTYRGKQQPVVDCAQSAGILTAREPPDEKMRSDGPEAWMRAPRGIALAMVLATPFWFALLAWLVF